MAKVTVRAGDFLKADGSFLFNSFTLLTEKHSILGEIIPVTELESVEAANEESVKKIAGTVGWGVARAVLLGPVGFLAGLLAGGRKKEVTFVAKFNDGGKLLWTADNKTFTKLQAAVF